MKHNFNWCLMIFISERILQISWLNFEGSGVRRPIFFFPILGHLYALFEEILVRICQFCCWYEVDTFILTSYDSNLSILHYLITFIYSHLVFSKFFQLVRKSSKFFYIFGFWFTFKRTSKRNLSPLKYLFPSDN